VKSWTRWQVSNHINLILGKSTKPAGVLLCNRVTVLDVFARTNLWMWAATMQGQCAAWQQNAVPGQALVADVAIADWTLTVHAQAGDLAASQCARGMCWATRAAEATQTGRLHTALMPLHAAHPAPHAAMCHHHFAARAPVLFGGDARAEWSHWYGLYQGLVGQMDAADDVGIVAMYPDLAMNPDLSLSHFCWGLRVQETSGGASAFLQKQGCCQTSGMW